jgi:glycosyltransferase involved in cell wall biosynthesis
MSNSIRLGEVPKILLVAEYISHGGTREYFKALLQFYKHLGVEVVTVTSFEEPDPEMQLFSNSLHFELMTFRQFAGEAGLQLKDDRPAVWSSLGFRREADAFAKFRSDRGLAHTVISVGTPGLFLSAVRNSPASLMIAHGYPHGKRSRVLGRIVMGNRVPRSMRLVTVSNFSAQQFVKLWGINGDGNDLRTVHSTFGRLLVPSPLHSRKQLVMTAALVESYKRPLDWIKIAGQVRQKTQHQDTLFKWFGVGPMLDQARETASFLGQNESCFPGWSSNINPIYDEAKVYLQTSDTEALGLSVVDALRHGLPAVVSDAGGLPEVVEHGVNGFVFPVGDTEAAASAVSRLLEDSAVWQEFSQASQRIYLERFAPHIWEQRIQEAHGRITSTGT